MSSKYSEIAKRHWQTTNPARYHALEDPETFFQELGEQVETQVQVLAQHLADPDQPGEEYLQKVGRLNMARLQAEEAVLTELVWTSSAERETAEPQTSEPATEWVTQMLREMRAADPDNEPIDD